MGLKMKTLHELQFIYEVHFLMNIIFEDLFIIHESCHLEDYKRGLPILEILNKEC